MLVPASRDSRRRAPRWTSSSRSAAGASEGSLRRRWSSSVRAHACTQHYSHTPAVYATSVRSEHSRPGEGLAGPVTIISPHLDDAVLSLGAAIARAVRGGSSVSVLTVFAGDESSTEPADDWARRCGFATEGEAYRTRREEDRRATAWLGASAEHLPLDVGADDGEILSRLGPALGCAE